MHFPRSGCSPVHLVLLVILSTAALSAAFPDISSSGDGSVTTSTNEIAGTTTFPLTSTFAPESTATSSSEVVATTKSQQCICEDPGSWCKSTETGPLCPCKPGFYQTLPQETCSFGLEFGGKLYLESNKYFKIRSSTICSSKDVNDLLHLAYNETDGFLHLDVLTTSDSSPCDYLLYYDVYCNTDETSISDYFASFVNLNCQDTNNCNVSGTIVKIDMEKSKQNAGNVNCIPCKSEQMNGYCEDSTSYCQNEDGYTRCKCNDNHIAVYSERSCEEIVCFNDSGCNAPFGKCHPSENNGVGECSCMFGFDGNHCYAPWLFVFIIVGGFLSLLVLVLLICVCVRSSTKNKKNTDSEFDEKVWKDDWNGTIPNHNTLYSAPNLNNWNRAKVNHNGTYNSPYELSDRWHKDDKKGASSNHDNSTEEDWY